MKTQVLQLLSILAMSTLLSASQMLYKQGMFNNILRYIEPS